MLNRRIKVAFFHHTGNLGQWSWDALIAGRFAASGTDGQFLHLVARLSGRDEVDVLPIFSGGMPEAAPTSSRDARNYLDAVDVAIRNGANILVSNNRPPRELAGAIERASAQQLPLVIWDQNGPFSDTRDLLARADVVRRVVVVSHSHADTLRGSAVFRKIAVIYNALLFDGERGRTQLERLERRVCFLGATIPEKGFHHVVRMWPSVRKACPEAELIVIGSARLYARGRPLGPLGLGDPEFERECIVPYWGDSPEGLVELGICLHGLVAPADLPILLGQCVVAVVNPCVRNGSYETFCVSAIEAQAAGCAVVGGRRLGLRETVRHGETGILIRREKDLAPAILGLLQDPAGAKAMGDAGSRWVRETFSAAKADARWVELFADVVAGRPNRAPRLDWRVVGFRSIMRGCLRKINSIQNPSVGRKFDRGEHSVEIR